METHDRERTTFLIADRQTGKTTHLLRWLVEHRGEDPAPVLIVPTERRASQVREEIRARYGPKIADSLMFAGHRRHEPVVSAQRAAEGALRGYSHIRACVDDAESVLAQMFGLYDPLEIVTATGTVAPGSDWRGYVTDPEPVTPMSYDERAQLTELKNYWKEAANDARDLANRMIAERDDALVDNDRLRGLLDRAHTELVDAGGRDPAFLHEIREELDR